MRAWQQRDGTQPSSYDWSRTMRTAAAARRSPASPTTAGPPTVTVTDLYRTWAADHADALA